MFAAGLTPGVGAGLGAGCPHLGQCCRGMVILCAASTHLQMPVASGAGSSWKKMCEWLLLLQMNGLRCKWYVMVQGRG